MGAVQHGLGAAAPSTEMRKRVSNSTSPAGVPKWFNRHEGGATSTPLHKQMSSEGYYVPSHLYDAMQATVSKQALEEINTLLNDPSVQWADVIQLEPCENFEKMKASLDEIKANRLQFAEDFNMVGESESTAFTGSGGDDTGPGGRAPEPTGDTEATHSSASAPTVSNRSTVSSVPSRYAKLTSVVHRFAPRVSPFEEEEKDLAHKAAEAIDRIAQLEHRKEGASPDGRDSEDRELTV